MARRRRIPIAAVAALALAGAAPVAAPAAPAADGTFPTSGAPKEMTAGPGGAVWFVLSGSATNKEFGRIAPDGTVTEYDTPNNQGVKGIGVGPDVAGGPNDRVWLTQDGGVVKWDPVAGSGTAFPLAGLSARGIAPDAQGNLWVVDAGDGLMKIAPNGTKIDDAPVTGSNGRGITLGSDGRMWWADFLGKVRATTTSAPYPTSTYETGGSPQDIAAGPTGQLAYSAPSDALGRISTAGEVLPTPAPGADATGVTRAADGAYWFAEFATNKVARLTPEGGFTEPIALPAGSGPRYIAAGAGGTVWVGLDTANKILRVSGIEPPATGGGGPVGPGPGGGTVDPPRDTVAPVLDRLRLDARRRRMSVRIGEPARLRVSLTRRRSSGRYVRVRFIQRNGRSGRNVVSFGRRLRAGRYRVAVVAVDAAGNRSRSVRGSFRVRPS